VGPRRQWKKVGVLMDWPERFEQYKARKEREALSVTIDPLVTEIERDGAALRRVGNEWSRRLFDGDFYVSPPRSPDLPSTSLVFVQSRDGNTGAKNPSSLGGGETDKHLIYEGLSRVAADAVLMGAETVRGGNLVMSVWHPELVALRASLGLPRHPVQIVATLRGMNLDTLLFNLPELPVILLTVPACTDLMLTGLADRPWITPIVMPASRDLPHAFRELRQRGIATISCIGGRTIAAQLLDAGLIQDVYLTTSAKEGGEPNTPLYSKPIGGRAIVRKHGTGVDSGMVFEMIGL
jgi:riboflavin biosynthesis pyrimidine reductase